jgi:hypothetical protein
MMVDLWVGRIEIVCTGCDDCCIPRSMVTLLHARSKLPVETMALASREAITLAELIDHEKEIADGSLIYYSHFHSASPTHSYALSPWLHSGLAVTRRLQRDQPRPRPNARRAVEKGVINADGKSRSLITIPSPSILQPTPRDELSIRRKCDTVHPRCGTWYVSR